MEGEDGDSAIASVTSNPSSFEQMYGDLDKCFFKEPLPNPGPIPPKLSEFVPEEEEPSVEKDICREKRPSASELHWGKRNPRLFKVTKHCLCILFSLLTQTHHLADVIPARTPNWEPSVFLLFDASKEEWRKGCAHISATLHRAAQTLLDIKSSKPNLSSSPKFLKGSAKGLGRIEKQRSHLNWQQQAPSATAAFNSKEHLSVPKLVTLRAEHNMGQLQFLFQKGLTYSDVHKKRIVLPKKEAEIHLAHVCPPIGTTVIIVMKDFDTDQSWKFGYRLWIYKNKIMHTLEQTGEFTKAHELQEGHLFCLYKNSQGDYVVQGKILMRSGSKRPRVTI